MKTLPLTYPSCSPHFGCSHLLVLAHMPTWFSNRKKKKCRKNNSALAGAWVHDASQKWRWHLSVLNCVAKCGFHAVETSSSTCHASWHRYYVHYNENINTNCWGPWYTPLNGDKNGCQLTSKLLHATRNSQILNGSLSFLTPKRRKFDGQGT